MSPLRTLLLLDVAFHRRDDVHRYVIVDHAHLHVLPLRRKNLKVLDVIGIRTRSYRQTRQRKTRSLDAKDRWSELTRCSPDKNDLKDRPLSTLTSMT